jgi:hypothetical protein
MKLMNMMYKSADLPEAVSIQNMVFRFSPKNLALEQFDAKMGKSDFKINGTIDNYMGYIFGKEADLLKGKFDFESSNLDLDQLMGLSTTSETSTITLSYSLSTSANDFKTFKVFANYKFNGDIENLDIPVPVACIANAHHYRIKVECTGYTEIYNIERRFRTRGRTR